MTERKWTPGPWHTKAEFDHMIVHRETGGVVADCAITVPGPVTDDELRANARLIAAAPDLYEALRTTRGYILDAFGEGHPLDIIDAALARAEGKS